MLTGLVLAYLAFGWRWFIFSPPVLFLGYLFLRFAPGILDFSSSSGSLRPMIALALTVMGVNVAVVVHQLRWSATDVASKVHPRGRNGVLELSAPTVVGNQAPLGRAPSRSESNRVVLVAIAMVILGVASAAVTFQVYGRVPLALLLQEVISGSSGSDLSMHEARRMNTFSHRDGATSYFGQGYLRTLYATVAPVFLGLLYLNARAQTRGSLVALLRFLMIVFVLIAAANGQIWLPVRVASYFLLVVAIDYWLHKGRRDIRSMAVTVARVSGYVFALALAGVGFRYLQSLSGRQFGDTGAVWSGVRRIFNYSPGPLFELFPESLRFRFGSTWLSDLSGLLPGSRQSFAYEVHQLVHGGGWGYTLSPGTIASGYVNFGFAGVFFLAFAGTLGFSLIYSSLVHRRRPFEIAAALFVSHGFAFSIEADVASWATIMIVGIAMSSLVWLVRREAGVQGLTPLKLQQLRRGL
jgi:hypothetical protein